MGAWIEITTQTIPWPLTSVAPVWGRGLKYMQVIITNAEDVSPPYGGVD